MRREMWLFLSAVLFAAAVDANSAELASSEAEVWQGLKSNRLPYLKGVCDGLGTDDLGGGPFPYCEDHLDRLKFCTLFAVDRHDEAVRRSRSQWSLR